jgi:dTDP-4-amino-4,6-dideoxygalactose transaminase
MKEKIWLSSPHMGGDEQKFIKEAFDTNWVAPLGPNVDGFEKELCSITGAKYAAALSSGTAAIHLAMIISNIGPGDVVLCQSFTFSATANPIAYQGATPVFIDSEPGTWNMDPALIEEAIIKIRSRKTQRGKTGTIKAIVPVHLYGMPAKMDEIMAISRKYDIPVIEDAAEALGTKYNGQPTGTFGKFGILSFNGNKIITTSGGGALLSDDEDLINKARFLATQARDKASYYQHSQIGYNYRMSNITAGIGRGQLEVLTDRVRKRREINQWYRNQLKDIPGISFQTAPSGKHYSNHWLTAIIIDPKVAGTDREKVRLSLAEENIEARPLWKPMHLQPVFADAPRFINGVSEGLFNNGLCLPSGSNLKEEEFERILVALKKVLVK